MSRKSLGEPIPHRVAVTCAGGIVKRSGAVRTPCWTRNPESDSVDLPGRCGRQHTGAPVPVVKHGPGVAAAL